MKLLSIRWGAGALLFLAACGGGQPSAEPSKPSPTIPTPSATKSGPRLLIAEHISYSYDDAGEQCLEVPIEGEISLAEGIAGIDALRLAWDEVKTARVDGEVVLCTLGGFGAKGCNFKEGKWRHYIVPASKASNRSPERVRATDDPTAYRVRSGELDAWLWIPRTGDEPAIGTDFEEVCEDYL